MGIEKLKDALLSEANGEATGIVSSAEAQAKTLLEEVRNEDASARAEVEKEISRILNEQRNERSAWARLEAKRIMAEAYEETIKMVLDDFFEVLATMKKSAEYKRFMRESVERAVEELGGAVIIHAIKGEKDLLPKLKGVKILEDLDALGGVLIESTDGKLRVNLTLEALYDARRDDLRKMVHEKIFGGK